MRKITLSLAVVLTLFAAQLTKAADVNVILELDPTASTFDVLLAASGSTTGIASYGVPVTGTFANLDHNSPNTGFAQDAAFVGGAAGFSFLRSADGVALLGASQDTIAPTPHLINGFGLNASSFAAEGLNPLGGTPDGDSWDADLRIASGTYTVGDEPSIDISSQGGGFVNIFLTGGGIEAAGLTFEVRTAGPTIPEPTSLALAGLGLVGLLGSRRRRS